ncbi:MAG TPA: hypothetical protein VFW38_09205 [Solirubrobacteraceae bacterium]|nr:hypothetical protein [Solirubrobacteraceae bacterium]
MTAIHCCTVVSRNYLAHARVLAESFLEHNPHGRFSLLLVDRDLDGLPDAGEPAANDSFELLLPEDVGVDRREFDRRATMYSAQGMAASLKPDMLRTLLARQGGPVVAIDADGCVYDDLTPIAELARAHAVVLSPHSLDPYPLRGANADSPRWGRDSPDQMVMRSGVMNGGLVAVGRGGDEFLDWWSQRTRRRCVFDVRYGLMLVQTWLTPAAFLFDSAVLRDRGCNVAGWNMQARDVQWEGELPLIDGGPLRHFHFAGGFDPERPGMLSWHPELLDWWPSLDERPGAARLTREYADRLFEAGYRELRAMPGPSDFAPDGKPIEPWMREIYRQGSMEAERRGEAEPPNPFSDGAERFAEWLSERVQEADGGSTSPQRQAERALDPGRPELRSALFEAGRLLERVGELERIRDEAIGWAERVSAELRESEAALAAARAEVEGAQMELRRALATLEGVLGSVSWRLTKPLRGLKASFKRPLPRVSRRRA